VRRVNVSLDTLDDQKFADITRLGPPAPSPAPVLMLRKMRGCGSKSNAVGAEGL